jgi:hypothetical protein
MDWKDQVIRSLEGAKRAAPNPLLYDDIRIKIAGAKLQVVRRPYLALAAACLAFLITANIWALSQRSTGATSPSVYQVEVANFNLY